MKIKGLLEKQAEILEKIELENESETRSTEKIDELFKELDGVKEQISKEKEIEERLLSIKKDEVKKMDKKLEVRDYNLEIREAIAAEKELDITKFEIEERAMGTPTVQGGNGNSVGNVMKTTFAQAVIKKAAENSDLYKYVRKENFGSSTHTMNVQKTKVGEFLNVKELAAYAEKDIDFNTIPLSAHKFGNISVVSEEVVADSSINIMAELLEQYGEGAASTIDKLLVKGDATGVQGLASFVNGAGASVDGALIQTVPGNAVDTLGMEELIELYNKLPHKYAKNGTWVISTEMAARLNGTVDGVGRPLLSTDFSQVPFGAKPTPTLFGRPVVISDHVQALTGSGQHQPLAFFGDLSKALVMGVRKSFTIKSSTEYAWAKDGIAIKGTMRIDAKRALGEAIAVMVRGA